MQLTAVAIWLIAQVEEGPDPGMTAELMRQLWWWSVWHQLYWLISSAFMLWMLIHCIRHDPERNMWIWIILIMSFAYQMGALLYFFIRYLPGSHVKAPSFLKRWTRGRELDQLETAARQIGNAHQFFLWGEALRETRNYPRAKAAFDKALEKDPSNLPALWGAAQSEMAMKSYAPARSHVEKILETDPSYKFGDVSLAYGRILLAQDERELARAHFEKHVRRWKQPEAYYHFASLLAARGDVAQARENLEAMLLDLRGSPRFFSRQNREWSSKGQRLLRSLPREKSPA